MSPPEVAADISVDVAAGALRWSPSAGHERQIKLTDIVGIVRASASSTSAYRVLYIENTSSANEKDETPSSVTHFDLASLPDGLSSHVKDLPAYLCKHKPVHVVVSTQSGTGTAKDVFRNGVEPFLQSLGLVYEITETQSSQTILELAQSRFLEDACAGIAQTIILLSGDGGLVDLIDVFSKCQRSIQAVPDIALIPCGTGNAMASSIGLRSGPIDAVRTLLSGQSCSVPTIAVRFSPGAQLVIGEGRQRALISNISDPSQQTLYGAVVASWGLHAALVADSDTTEYRKFGMERFKMAATELLHPTDGSMPHRFQGRIKLTTSRPSVSLGGNGDESGCQQPVTSHEYTLPETEHMYVLTTLVPRLEKDFVISPASKALDGRMRFLRFGPLSGEEAMRLLMLAYQDGAHVKDELMTYEEVERVRIDFDEEMERWRRVCIDGKIVAVEQSGWMEISMDARRLLNLITPIE
ncbi:Uncharacterized protein PECH_000571 [Penicillium ucsense]|uniref:DAGKc domain-containing protein n=1 Tax=Penicillium ucsense TaxID=2839758 RepID=A0A8J8WEQ8_9EURO|nr:Uncharacterized protein PECM_000944 [Penicillium ucsense]KAF7733470.1 Uncharacterized protein PECH_000571 [Penicillium ucsense]